MVINPGKKVAPALWASRTRARSKTNRSSVATNTSRLSAVVKSQRQHQRMRKEQQRLKLLQKKEKETRSNLLNPGVSVVRRQTFATILRRKKFKAITNFLELKKRKSSFHRRLIDLHRRKSIYPLISHAGGKGYRTVFYRRTPADCLRKHWGSLGDVSADEDTDDQEGRWDFWRAYYCNRPEIAAATPINPFYLAWTILYTIGQNSHMTLIQMTFENGGVAFLLVCLVVYIGVGYPLYVMETMIGQYGGRKTLTMFRFMAPYLQGIGPALWLRTFFVGLECLVTAVYSLHYCLDLYVCHLNHNNLLRGFWYSMDPETVKLGGGTAEAEEEDQGFFLNSYYIEWAILSILITTILALMKLRTFGHIYVLVWKGAFLVWTGYLLIAILRTITSAGTESIMYFPLLRFLRTDWGKVLSPKVWMDAVLYVISSLGLVTIVHPYFGSRSFYHYRAPRDGVIIIGLTIVWNLLGAGSVLLFLGYVTPSRKEMCNSLAKIGGFYGLFVTYPMKHLQSYILQDLSFHLKNATSPVVCSQPAVDDSATLYNVVEYDIQFYCSIFFAMVALVALCAFHCCLGALIACSFQEYTSTLLAITVGLVILLIYALLTPVVFLSNYGLTLLLTIEFYLHKTFSVIFVAFCVFWGLAYSHRLSKFVYDFRNMMHIPIFEPRNEDDIIDSHFTVLFRHVIFICIVGIFVHMVVRNPYPVNEGVQFTLTEIILGLILTGLPIAYIVFVYLLVCFQRFYGAKFTEKHFAPHRDWYKNWFHIVVCFAAAPLKRHSDHLREQQDAFP